MIIDMFAHIGARKGEDYRVESLLEIMDDAGVDMCQICSQLETVNNDYIYECAQKYPNRVIPYAVINPWDMDSDEELEKCFRDYNFYGVKLSAIRFGYAADRHSVLDSVFNLCQKYGKNVVVHGQSDLFSLPDKWAEMARSFPDVPLILNHIGIPMMYDRAIELARTLPNFYLNSCGSYVPVIKLAIEKAGYKKLLYSSDAPFGDQKQEIEKIKYCCDDPVALEYMLGRNAAELLGIKYE